MLVQGHDLPVDGLKFAVVASALDSVGSVNFGTPVSLSVTVCTDPATDPYPSINKQKFYERP
jgi:hypothetical protein